MLVPPTSSGNDCPVGSDRIHAVRHICRAAVGWDRMNAITTNRTVSQDAWRRLCLASTEASASGVKPSRSIPRRTLGRLLNCMRTRPFIK